MMPVSEQRTDSTAAPFVLTDIRTSDDRTCSALIDEVAGREVTARLAQPPRPGAAVQVNLGDQGWVDGVVRWTGGHQARLELQREIEWTLLLGD